MKKTDKMILAMLSAAMLAAAGCSASQTAEIQSEKEAETAVIGGWTKAEDGTITPEIQEMFDKAMESLIGVDYKAVEVIETQVVNGINYRILAEAKTVTPGAEARQVIITINQDSEGNVDVMNIEDVENESTSIANPFVTVDTIEEAEKAAGFSFLVPEEIEGYTEKTISYTNFDMIQVVYGSDEDSIMVRKMEGSDDISGDYNIYETEEETVISLMNVTLKANKDGIHTILWTDGGYTYSINSEKGLSMDVAESLIASIQ